jgi:signal transduction histidine kinase
VIWARVRVWSVLAVPLTGLIGLAALVIMGGAPQELRDRVVLAAFTAGVLSIGVASWNAQWVARRVQSLTAAARQVTRDGGGARAGARNVAQPLPAAPEGTPPLPPGGGDSFDGLAAELHHASSAVSQERREIAGQLAAAEARAGGLAALLDAVAAPLGQATSEAQLPLHILLENHFGDLNENQEEMLQAASDATDRIDLAARQLRRILDLEHGRLTFQREAVRPDDLLQPVLAIASARAESRGANVAADVAPGLPSVIADRYLLEEALTALCSAAVDEAAPSTPVTVNVVDDASRVRIELHYAGAAPGGLDAIMATHLIHAQGGAVTLAPGGVTIALPAERRAQAVARG